MNDRLAGQRTKFRLEKTRALLKERAKLGIEADWKKVGECLQQAFDRYKTNPGASHGHSKAAFCGRG